MKIHLQELLDKVTHFDCKPQVFTARIEASDHQSGYTAVATFRAGHGASTARSIQYAGPTPEEAAFNLLTGLQKHFAACPTCGEYPSKKAT